MSKKKSIEAILAAVFIMSLAAVPALADGEEELFFLHKGRDNLEAALSAAVEGGSAAPSPAIAELWLFRLMELLRYPELMAAVDDGVRRVMERNSLAAGDTSVKARADIFRMEIALRRGDLAAAKRLRESLGFITKFRVIGPFAGSDHMHFTAPHPLEKAPDSTSRYEGRNGPVEWFDTETDLQGRADLDQVFRGTRNSVFYLRAPLYAERAGTYHLSLGKTGAAALWVDGAPVFSDTREHGFAFDQYRVVLELGAGKHDLLVKLGSSEDGCAAAVRFTCPAAPGQKGSGFFPALEYHAKKKDPTPRESFIMGSLLYFAKLNSGESREAQAAFAKAREDAALAPWALFYTARCEEEAGARERALDGAMALRDDFAEAVAALAVQRLGRDLAYEAAPLVKKISMINPDSVLGQWLEGELFLAKSWYLEVEKTGEALMGKRYPSAGHQLLGRVKKLQKEYEGAARHFEYLSGKDSLDLDSLRSLADCRAMAGRYREAADALSRVIALLPSDVAFRLRLAEMLDREGGPAKAVPALAAAHRISPSHPEVLFRLGEAYHRLGSEEAAKRFLGLAVAGDPQNFPLKRYHAFLYGRGSETDRFVARDDTDELSAAAERYRDEPAVVLLSEHVYRLTADGSHEKRVRLVYRVNQAGAIQDFSRQSIVINPKTDTLESVRCEVVNGTERVETSETHAQSLSEPESRLYYDMTAHVVSVPSLRPGSVINLNYTVKSRREEEYAGYFGERITIGGRHRVMKSSTVLVAPRDREVFCHLKNIPGGRLEERTVDGLRVLRVTDDAIAPFNVESGMSHYSEHLRSVTFTTHRSWEAMYRWYYGLLRGRMSASTDMLRDLERIITPGDGPRERVRKIFNHVTGRIRYVGFELGIGGIRPRSAGETYVSGMGDCKDITLVLVALLRAAGIDARMALVRTGDRGVTDMDTPWIGAFNHAICFVNIDGGFFLDGTAELAGYREIPEFDRNVPALVMDERGFRFIEVESPRFERNLLAIENEVALGADGSASVVRRFHKQGGMYAPSGRYALQEESGIMGNISEFWNGAYPGSAISDFRVLENGLEKPVRYEYSVKVPSFGQAQDGIISFRSMMVPTNAFRSYGSVRRRKLPLFLGGEFDSLEIMRYRIPEGFEAHRVPENGKFTAGKSDAECLYALKEGGRLIEVTHRVNYRQSRVSVEEYAGFREMLKFINARENELIILRKKGAGR
ncbi:MAG TPA: DUF3857 domain-containing protein [Spirochaetota bacterium]|nr:DUF3857 domain-containing protein [Spirochaetota bacterium]